MDQTTLIYDKESDRVVITGNEKKLLITSYKQTSILLLFWYANQIKTNKDEYLLKNTIEGDGRGPYVIASALEHVESPNYTEIDYILINENTRYEACLPPKPGRLNEIIVYTDIIDTVLVGYTQAPMLRYFPIQSNWGDQSYWNFNPPYYVKVKESSIRAISVRLCDEKEETVAFESGTVICRLNYRRVGLMRVFL